MEKVKDLDNLTLSGRRVERSKGNSCLVDFSVGMKSDESAHRRATPPWHTTSWVHEKHNRSWLQFEDDNVQLEVQLTKEN